MVGDIVRLAIDAGAVGCDLEDSFPANGKLRAPAAQADRIRRARLAADGSGIRFFINVRTDVFFQAAAEQHDDSMVVEAIARGRVYAEAVADGICAPGLADIRLIARLAREIPLPLNIMVGGGTAPLRVLAESGVARVSHGPGPYIMLMKALEEAERAAR